MSKQSLLDKKLTPWFVLELHLLPPVYDWSIVSVIVNNNNSIFEDQQLSHTFCKLIPVRNTCSTERCSLPVSNTRPAGWIRPPGHFMWSSPPGGGVGARCGQPLYKAHPQTPHIKHSWHLLPLYNPPTIGAIWLHPLFNVVGEGGRGWVPAPIIWGKKKIKYIYIVLQIQP